MAQGIKKSVSVKKSVASVKKQQNQKLAKGRKTFKAKGRSAASANEQQATSKAINRKNEITFSARAVTAGNTFFLHELKDKAKAEIERKNRNQTRDEKNTNNLSAKLKQQLRKMGQDV